MSDKTKGDVIDLSAEKFERRLTEEASKTNKRITTEVEKINERITIEVAKINERIMVEVAKLEGKLTELDKKISEAQANLIKWMFIFWIGQIGAILGILFAFFK